MDRAPCQNSTIQRLLAFCSSTDGTRDRYTIQEGTLLYSKFTSDRPGDTRVFADKLEVSTWELDWRIRVVLHNRLRSQVLVVLAACRELVALQPCIHHAVYSRCSQDECRRSHADASANIYNARVTIHLLEITIYNTICAFDEYRRRRHQQR